MIGYKYISEFGIEWRLHHNTLIPLTPPHVSPECTRAQVRSMISRQSVYLARWDSDFDNLQCGEWWHVIKDGAQDIAKLKSSTRSEIRRSLKRTVIERCDRKLIEELAYPVYHETFQRYKTFENVLPPEEFRRSIDEMPVATEFWVVWCKDKTKLLAFAENFISSDACFYNSIWFTPEALSLRASYGLFHTMNTHYLNDRSLDYVSDGARSINHVTGIQDFLIQKFGFRKAYSNLNLVYSPWIGALVKALFPFASVIQRLDTSFTNKINVLLKQERIRRSCLTQIDKYSR